MKQALIDKLKAGDEFVIVTHISPDADAISSSIGLAQILSLLGKKAKVFFEEDIPNKFKKLISLSYLINSEQELISLLKTSTLVGVDCATKKRLGDVVNKHFELAKDTLNIDHHESNENWAKINWVVKDSPATASLIHELAGNLEVKIPQDLANLLYSGIMDDTGCFRYANTTSECLNACADLIKQGAKPQYISSILYYEIPERVLKLRALAASTLETFAQGKIALIYVTKKILEDLNCVSDDTEGLIDLVCSVEGVKIAFFAREIDNGYKVSVRSKEDGVDVNKFAERFGGGGHKMAAGFTLNQPLEKVLDILRTDSLILI